MYLHPLSSSTIPTDVHKIIFRNWDDLLEVHRKLSEQINLSGKDQIVDVWLPIIFTSFRKFLPQATEHMRVFAKGVDLAEEAIDGLRYGTKTNEEFKKFLQQ